MLHYFNIHENKITHYSIVTQWLSNSTKNLSLKSKRIVYNTRNISHNNAIKDREKIKKYKFHASHSNSNSLSLCLFVCVHVCLPSELVHILFFVRSLCDAMQSHFAYIPYRWCEFTLRTFIICSWQQTVQTTTLTVKNRFDGNMWKFSSNSLHRYLKMLGIHVIFFNVFFVEHENSSS